MRGLSSITSISQSTSLGLPFENKASYAASYICRAPGGDHKKPEIYFLVQIWLSLAYSKMPYKAYIY